MSDLPADESNQFVAILPVTFWIFCYWFLALQRTGIVFLVHIFW
jgi:hypothetical protein